MKEKIEHAFNKIVLAGEQVIYVAGLAQMLNRLGAAMHITSISNRDELKTCLQKKIKPDLIVFVAPFKQFKFTSLLDNLLSMNNHCQVMLMAEDHEVPLVLAFVKEGIKVVVSKSCSEQQLISALNSVSKNKSCFAPAFAEAVFNRSINALHTKAKIKVPLISDREKDIIRLMWKDYTNKEIADTLNISLRTIESHRQNIYDKLNVKTLGGIFKFGIENGIIS